jgi:hypothetical protein
MGLVIMSERELNRIEVLAQVDDGRLSVQNGANMLDVTKRQMFRLLKLYRADGAAPSGIRPQGHTPSQRLNIQYHCSGSVMIRADRLSLKAWVIVMLSVCGIGASKSTLNAFPSSVRIP